MTISVSTNPLLFGILTVPLPEILEAGFLVIEDQKEFVKARKDGQDYFIKPTGPHSFELWPCKYDGQKTILNPLGEFIDISEPPLLIPSLP